MSPRSDRPLLDPIGPLIGAARGLFRWGLVAAALAAAGPSQAQTVRGSKHDLSYNIDAVSNQVCIFCHTPHNANNQLSDIGAPLWNRVIDRTKVLITYSSPTMVGTPGNPYNTVSALCLGCHDGSAAGAVPYNGLTFSDKHEIINAERYNQRGETPNCQSCHANLWGLPRVLNIGPNLSNDHPIAVAYPTSLSNRFRTPPDPQNGWPDAKLYNGKVECGSCHRVHDPTIPPFLRKSNTASALCLTCHVK